MNLIGLRKEEKLFETRVAVVPKHVEQLGEEHGIRFLVEPNDQRAFSAEEYRQVSAEIAPLKGSEASIILGIKEMPLDFFEPGKAYVFFSHTIKGQSYNMPMLRKIIDVGATLIDYERVVDSKGRRLIYFGNWAGMAGMSDTVRILGQRLSLDGVSPNPFADIKPTMECSGLDGLKEEFKKLGERISTEGLPDEIDPLIVGFAGYGNVSRGAQELFDLLPHKTVLPDELPDVKKDSNHLFKCVFKEEHMVAPIDPSVTFDLYDYYEHGSSKYKGTFERYIKYLTVLMNCIYWSRKYPRLVTKQFMKKHWNEPGRRLRVIGDISCDIDGAVEITVECTDPGEPAFTYLVEQERGRIGIEGEGPVIMAVDNLPSELPRESSTSFSETLLDFVPALANADFGQPFEDLGLPDELKNAVIVYRGQLTNNYSYLKQYI